MGTDVIVFVCAALIVVSLLLPVVLSVVVLMRDEP